MTKINKVTAYVLIFLLIAFTFFMCILEINASGVYATVSDIETIPEQFDENSEIIVYSREEGAGLRSELIDYIHLNNELINNEINDLENKPIIVTISDYEMINRVAKNENAIGYTTLSNASSKVDVFAINGVYPTIDNLKSGEYPFRCPYYLVHKSEPVGIIGDFMRFVSSPQGCMIISQEYVCERNDIEPFESEVKGGKIVIEGASSMVPIMEDLVAGYLEYNPSAKIVINATDSDVGAYSVLNNEADIAMVARDLTEEEKAELHYTKLAEDALVIIKNHDNEIDNLSTEQIKNIFSGLNKKWKDLQISL